MGLRERVMLILRSSDAQRISFSITGASGSAITVNGAMLGQVAQAIEDGTITVQSGGVGDGWAKYSARAEGSDAANTLYVGTNNTGSRDFAGLIVHEAVQAAFDLARTTIPWIDNEVVAYIAQGYYYRNSGFRTSRMDPLGMPYLGRMIVDDIRSGGDAGDFWIGELRASLLADPTYHSYIRGTFTGDG
ncbi:MAG TPA: hypothetical protein PKO33_04685 [Pyrinomonadaceae bacterium]|nr:hypothetical protein [Pyrinomonadaceae bacterium]